MAGQSFDVVIVGGGVIGSATAYFLAACPDFGGTVAVIERDPTYEFCSTVRATGGIRQQFSTAENVLIGLYGAHFFKTLGEHLAVDGEVPSISFRENGYLLLAPPEFLPEMQENHRLQTSLGAKIGWFDADALQKRLPEYRVHGLAGAFLGLENEGWYDPWALLQAFRRKARSLGVTYFDDEAVGLDRRGDRIDAVDCAKAGRIGAGAVINCAGARDAAKVADWAGVKLCVVPRVRTSFVVATKVDCASWPLTFHPNGVWGRPEGKGYLCGVQPDMASDEPTTEFIEHHELFEEVVWPTLADRIPAFEELRLERSYCGHYDYNELDQNAVIGLWPGFMNFYVGTGYSGHGVMQAPASGRALMELVVYGRYRSLDLTRFGAERLQRNQPVLETGVY